MDRELKYGQKMRFRRIKYCKRLDVIFLLSFVFFWAITPQSASKEAAELNPQQKELQALRQEIEKYEKNLSQSKQKESNILNLIASLDREIDATTAYLRSLQKDIKKRQRQIEQHEKDIERTTREIEKLKELIKKRIVAFYKHQRLRSFELLLSSTSLTQVKVWMRYQKMIIENDRRNYLSLQEKKQKLEREKELLKVKMAEQAARLKERRAETASLKKSREKRERYLASIRGNQKILAQRLKEVKEAERQIMDLIARAEETRLTRQSRLPQGTEPQELPYKRAYKFSELKGKLIWPIKGKVISRFGRYKHPQLKTVTENLGIEIKARLGAPVHAVDDGIVQVITWQRGRGNIIIISHDDGYYTVYTHLAEILVETQEYVKAGQVIGTVGDSGSISGPVLHFQIWKNTQNLNPEDWLA